jgi:hypothetical protein
MDQSVGWLRRWCGPPLCAALVGCGAGEQRVEPDQRGLEDSSSRGSRPPGGLRGSALLNRLRGRPDIYAQVAQMAAAGVARAGQRAQVSY